jgi:Xaa-Pro aminopeptidase
MRRLILLVTFVAFSFPLLAFERQPNADYHARRERLAAKLGKGVLVLFAGTESEGQNATHGFRQNEDFYYLTGWREPGAGLIVAAASDTHPYTEILFLPDHNRSQERWTGPKLGVDSPDVKNLTGFDRVEVLDRMREELVAVLPSPMATVYTDLSDHGSTPSTVPIEWLRRANAFPNYASFLDAKTLLGNLRMTKDAGEISLIRKASDATVAAHLAAIRKVRAGMSENELSAIMQYEFERGGCEQPAYSPIVGSGFNSTVLHYSANSWTMKEGDVVLLDVGGEFSMYATDVTRTLPVSGRFSPRQREIYDIVLGAQQAAVAAFRPGVSTIGRNAPNTLYKVAYDYINTHGRDLHDQPLGKYFIHGLSHYVGLNVHDPGDTTIPLAPGAVFTIEPGIYIPDESLGVRIEDTYVVGNDGKMICLSCAIPTRAAEVEAMMKKE